MKLQHLLTISLVLLSSYVGAQCACPEIELSGEAISVSSVEELNDALHQANDGNGNLIITVMPGEYILSSNLLFISENMSNLTIIGSTGNKDDVIIKGQGWENNDVTHIFNVAADNFTVANMTIGEVFYHPIQVHSNPSDADNFLAQNVRFIDAKEQLLKVSGGGDLYADNGVIRCCEFEFTNGIAYQYYTGGIDAHRAKDWEVSYNSFKGIRSPETNLAEHAIHFWKESTGTIVEANLIIDCDRGIGFGLGEGLENGHTGGLIMNNMVHTSRDVGIGLETSTDTKIYNNTVLTENYPRSIEYRFQGTTDALMTNNLVNGEISDRSSGSTGVQTTNYQFASNIILLDAANFDFHLAEMPSWIVGQGTFLAEVTIDFDCQERPLIENPDIGADQAKIVSSILDKFDDFNLLVSPNPSSGIFTLAGNIDGASIKIFNNIGQLIFSESTASNNLEIKNLDSGVYYLHASKMNKVTSRKIIITK